jgi:hypothetical protein
MGQTDMVSQQPPPETHPETLTEMTTTTSDTSECDSVEQLVSYSEIFNIPEHT